MGSVGAGPAFGAIGELPGDEETALAADLHAVEALIEAGNEAAHALGKCEGLRIAMFGLSIGIHDGFAVFVEDWCAWVVVGRIELVAVGSEPAGVLHLVHFVRLGDSASAELDVLVAEGEGRLYESSGRRDAGGKLDG
jgi:hypothetical protein